MTALHDLQQAMARAVITGQCDDAAPAIMPDAPGAAARLNIYHNHYRVTLIEALASTFPATLAAVGEAHFRAAARGFILTQPPTEPSLAAYGVDFPTFLAHLPPLAPWPYLSDLARLEWALNAACHAPDTVSVCVERLTALDEAELAVLRLRLHPSCFPLALSSPADRIRRSLLAGDTLEEGDWTLEPCRLLIFRDGDDVGWLQLPPAAFAFVTSLTDDGSLAKAATAAGTVDPSFDPAALLAALFNHGVVVDLSTPHS